MFFRNDSIGMSSQHHGRKIEKHLIELAKSTTDGFWRNVRNRHSSLIKNQMVSLPTLGTRTRRLTSMQVLCTPALRSPGHIVARRPPFRVPRMMGLLRHIFLLLILLSPRHRYHPPQHHISLLNWHLRRSWVGRCVSSLLGKLVRNIHAKHIWLYSPSPTS